MLILHAVFSIQGCPRNACNDCFPGMLEDWVETGQTRYSPGRFDPGMAAAISER